ncbi:MAG TPA: hypothetical protein EYG33_01655 [Candidatus Poseidoniales archaeon]|jgi:hypothetical protein|nr:MAG: hypothetical protein CXT68_08970 [Euryarchaeota archaeon]HIL64849.1 hypothetical protein [Candidatus Poseidoniales archaeon]
MPSADAKSHISIRFNSNEEKEHYKSKVSKKYDAKFAKWGAQLVRNHFKGESEDSPLVINLKQQVEDLANEFQRVETENLHLRRVLKSSSQELLEVRGRIYSSPDTYTAELFTMMYSWFLEHKETTRQELLSHIENAITVPNLVEEMRAIEKIFISQGVIEVKDGIIYCLVEG